MAVTREIKEGAYAKASKIFDESLSSVFVHFSGISGNEVKELRSELFDEKVGYNVFKKTLIKKAVDESKATGDMPVLDGEIAVAYSFDDETAAARKIKEFSKKYDGKIEIAGGIFEGKIKTKDEMMVIANIPSLHVLRGMFVNVINSPIQRCAVALGQIAESKA